MFHRFPGSTLVAICAAAVFVAGCDEKGTEPDIAGMGSVQINFDHGVSGQPLMFDQQIYTNASSDSYSVTKLQYIVSAFTLHAHADLRTEDHTEDVVHLRDAEDSGTRSITLTDVPAGEYGELTFTFGLDAAHNVTDQYPEYATMDWPTGMGGGYHYMKLEGNHGPSGANAYNTHTGATMGTDRSFPVSLVLSETARHGGLVVTDGETVEITVLMDLNEWYTGPNDYDFDDYGPIMDDAAAQIVLQENGRAGGAYATGVFSAE